MEFAIKELDNLQFNPKEPTIMHIDLNSCFASVEQQANHLLRNKPIAISAYNSPKGCIIAPSIEAKTYGIKVGMQVQQAKILCPKLIILEPDPYKYRDIHLKLKNLLLQYTNNLVPKSIDEFVLNLEGYPAQKIGLISCAKEIKQNIKNKIKDWLKVSIGIGPNRFLAKTGAGLNKPDGLDLIDNNNYMQIYKQLELTDLNGIASNNAVRLNNNQIHSVIDFYNATPFDLKKTFQSINGYYWYLRLRGWEIDDVDFGRKSFGNSFALPKHTNDLQQLTPFLYKLVEKATFRMRNAGYKAQGVHVSILYTNGCHWHKSKKTADYLYYFADVYKIAYKIFIQSPYKYKVRNIAVSCFNLTKTDITQSNLFDDLVKKQRLADYVDKINQKWGDSVITPAKILSTKGVVKDRISFGGVKELESIVIGN